MNKLLIFGDPHITLHNEFSSQTADGLTSYLHEILHSFSWLAQMIRTHRPSRVVCLGDVWDSTGILDTRSLNVGYRCFQKLHQACSGIGELDIVMGNHDLYDANAIIHNLEVLCEFGNVYAQPFAVDPFLFIPWTEYPQLVEEVLGTHSSPFIFSHLMIDEAVRFVGAKGIYNREDCGISPELFKGRVVFNGHYHQPGQIEKPDTAVVLAGSLLSRTFHDVRSPPRGAVLLTITPGRVWNWERLHNPHATAYVDIDLNEDESKKEPQRAADLDQLLHELSCTVTNARIFYPAKLEETARLIASHCKNARMQETVTADNLVVRNEELAPQFSPLKNLQNYIEMVKPEEGIIPDLLCVAEYLINQIDVQKIPRKITFRRISGRNFMGFDHFEYEYKCGLHLVEGDNQDDPTMLSNGSGKTSILVEALHWVLTGKLLRKVYADEVIREDSSGGCYVALELDIGEDQCKLTRSRGVSGTPPIMLFKNGVDIRARKKGDTEVKLEDELKISPNRLFQTILVMDDVRSRFSSLGPTERIKVVEEMAGASVYDELRELARVYRAEQQILYDEVESEITKKETTVAEAKRVHDEAQETLKTTMETWTSTVQILTSTLKSIRETLTQKEAELQEIPKEKLLYEEAVVALIAKHDSVQLEINVTEEKLNTVSLESRTNKAEILRSTNLHEQSCCPLCEHPVDHEKCSTKLSELQEQDKQFEITLTDIVDVQQTQTKRRRDLKNLLDEKQKMVNTLISTSATLNQEITQNRVTIERSERQLSTAEQGTSALEDHLMNLELSWEKATSDLEYEKRGLPDFEFNLSIAVWWFDALGPAGIRSFINDQSIQILNRSLAEYSPRVLGSGLGILSLSPFKKLQSGGTSNNIDIKLSGGRSFGKLSKGQQRRSDLAIQYALNDLSVSSSNAGANILISDEVLDPIDEIGCRGVVDILREKSKDLAIFLTTHNAYLKSMTFDHVWTIRKSQGISSLQTTGD